MLDAKMKELIAIGASVACNCQPCVKFHRGKAKKLNIENEHINTLNRNLYFVRTNYTSE